MVTSNYQNGSKSSKQTNNKSNAQPPDGNSQNLEDRHNYELRLLLLFAESIKEEGIDGSFYDLLVEAEIAFFIEDRKLIKDNVNIFQILMRDLSGEINSQKQNKIGDVYRTVIQKLFNIIKGT